jgi:hypothetical protein
MITIKRKLTGVLMAFALVASVLVGGVGASEANAAQYGNCHTVVWAVSPRQVTADNVYCATGYQLAATQYYYTAAYINAPKYTRVGNYVNTGGITVCTLPSEENVRISYSATTRPKP